jgi:H+-translocating NAD(P) transhydrogenase subunit beta
MTEALRGTGAPLVYMISTVLFFIGLKSLAKVRSARRGGLLITVALVLALVGTILETGGALVGPLVVPLAVGAVLGALLATRLSVAPAPSRTAWIGGSAGAAAALVGAGLLVGEQAVPSSHGLSAVLAAIFGGLAFLLGLGLSLRGSSSVKATTATAMVVSLGGWSAALSGYAVSNMIMLIAGGVAGATGLAIARIAASSSGRSVLQVLFAGAQTADAHGYTNVRSCGAEEAAMVLETAHNVVVVPGYGMAVAQAQHAVKEMAELLEKKGAKVVYAVHPAAGCMPGQINILLDEANVSHGPLMVADTVAPVVADADAVVVVGANDVVNTTAAGDRANPLYGLDVLDLSKARNVLVVKRSLRPGSAGVKNPLFEQPNTMMVFGDAKRVMQSLVAELKGGGH